MRRIACIAATILGLAGCAGAETIPSADQRTLAEGTTVRMVGASAAQAVRECVKSTASANRKGINASDLRRVEDALALRAGGRTFVFYTTEEYLVECRGEPSDFTELRYARTVDDVALASVSVEELSNGESLSWARVGSGTGRVALVIDGREVEAIRKGSIAAQITGKPDGVRLFDREGQLQCVVTFPLSAGGPIQRREQFERCSRNS